MGKISQLPHKFKMLSLWSHPNVFDSFFDITPSSFFNEKELAPLRNGAGSGPIVSRKVNDDGSTTLSFEFKSGKPEDVQIDFDETKHVLSVSGEHKVERKHKDAHYASSSSFKYSWSLPENMDFSKLKATKKNNTMNIYIPPVEQKPEEPEEIPISRSSATKPQE